MKFGDTLYQRSVPKWAAYNVNYNEIKRLIKHRTSSGGAGPVSIPSASSSNRWEALEDELFQVIKAQHDNVFLFLKSKYGELDRRIGYLERQVKSAQKAAHAPNSNPGLRSRRHHKLLEDAESIGEDIQSLTRYASVQKTAFRKILKKYRKWTGSTSLQTRVENEIFSAGQLNLDYAHPLEKVSTLSRIVTEELQATSSNTKTPNLPQASVSSSQSNAVTGNINAALDQGPVALDVALATLPFGKSSGCAAYWIHPDNLDEAEALLLRHVREAYRSTDLSRQNSGISVDAERSRSNSTVSVIGSTHVAYFDNAQRFIHDKSTNRPSKIAMSAQWCSGTEAMVTLSNLAPVNPSGSTINFRRKELRGALCRNDGKVEPGQQLASQSSKARRVQEYMSEHRDVKPLAELHSNRTRYVGNSNSSQVGMWATLDSNVVISPHDEQNLGLVEVDAECGEAFPHAVLNVRWEFSHLPEVVRAFDSTHLAERVHDFSLEAAAVHLVNRDLASPAWKPLLERDIRKVPIALKLSTRARGSAPRGRGSNTGMSSSTSSDGGPTESIFSAQQIHSSATSDVSPETSTRDPSSPTLSKPLPEDLRHHKRKQARIDDNAPSPTPRQSRYWNEFDDGDEDVNPQEAYTIYVDPDEKFPGAETVSRVAAAMYRSLDSAKSHLTSVFLPQSSQKTKELKGKSNERTGLLFPSSSSNTDDDADLSDSDTTPTRLSPSVGFGTFPQLKQSSPSQVRSASYYRPKQILTPRQEALERTYLQFYSGLLLLSYLLLFISGVLLGTGRKKKIFEVDIAVSAGIAAAEVCAVLSLILVWMRKSPLGAVHWGIVGVAITGVAIIGIGEIVGLAGRQPR